MLLSFLYPRRCAGCGRPGRYLCVACSRQLVPVAHPRCPVCGKPAALSGDTHPWCLTGSSPDGLISFFRYTGPIRRAIALLKYGGVSHIGEDLVSWCIPTDGYRHLVRRSAPSWILVPVPLHPMRLRQRGYNQSAILCRALARELHCFVRTDLLVRIKPTRPQVDQPDRSARLGNTASVFLVPARARRMLAGRRVFLVDDVATTGATVRSASAALKAGGALSVWGVTIAQ